MDLTYPPSLRQSLDRLGQTLGQLSLQDEIAACAIEPELWAGSASPTAVGEGSSQGIARRSEPAASPLAQFAQFRAMGAYALPLAELLARAGGAYVPLPDGATRGAVALGWPDATAPWQPGERVTAELRADGTISGSVSVAPFCVPAIGLVFLVQADADVALVECRPNPFTLPSPQRGEGEGGSHVERVGDAFGITLEAAPVEVLAAGDLALRAWERAVLWERLALVGLTTGLIDRAYRISLDALGEGQRRESLVASEQVAQFQLSDNYIDRLAAERLAQDVAVDAERGRPVNEKLAMVRYFTSGQAERCAARALHLASLLQPGVVPVARWLARRAHYLAVFGMAREHEVRLATAGLVAGMRLD